ncbi:MAG: rhamnulokinase [Clostridia bacterium]|nr:rhamnulokinase [Clostridia bacterium]
MSEMKFLAIDLGASSGRGIIGSFDGEKLSLRENHRFSNDPVNLAGTLHWDSPRIFHEIKNAIRKCASGEDRDIVSIGIDSWGVDYGLLDRNGKLLSLPVHYRDGRTGGVPEYADSVMPFSDMYSIAGIKAEFFDTLYQLIAAKRDNPELFDIAKSLLFTPDLFNYFLTGIRQSEYTITSTGLLLDANTRDYSDLILKTFGIPRDLFGKLVMPGTTVGELSSGIKEEVGEISAKVINVASHDTASAVISVPAVDDDFVFLSSGTWSLMGKELKNPCLTENARLNDFTNEGGVEGTIRFMQNIMGLWLEQESKRQWEREGEQITFDGLTNMAKECTPLKFLINPDDLLFAPPGNMPKRIAEYCEKTGQGTPESKGEIVRCIFDSLALRYRLTVDRIREVSGKGTKAVNIVGGGTKEVMLSELTADACGIPVYAGPVEATAMGNILEQIIAAGEIRNVSEARQVVRNSVEIKTYEPDPESRSQWDDAYDRFLTLSQKKFS